MTSSTCARSIRTPLQSGFARTCLADWLMYYRSRKPKTNENWSSFKPGDDGVFFGEFLSFGSWVVMVVKFAIHEAPSCAISQLLHGLDFGSASVTTMQISSPFPWKLSPPWLQLLLLPLRDLVGVTQGERFTGVDAATCWGRLRLETRCSWLQRRWLRYSLSTEDEGESGGTIEHVQRSVQKHWLWRKQMRRIKALLCDGILAASTGQFTKIHDFIWCLLLLVRQKSCKIKTSFENLAVISWFGNNLITYCIARSSSNLRADVYRAHETDASWVGKVLPASSLFFVHFFSAHAIQHEFS